MLKKSNPIHIIQDWKEEGDNRKITTKQRIEKVKAFLEPNGHETQRMVKKVMTVKPEEFMMIGGGYTKPEMFKTRWLHEKHEALLLNKIEKMK
ncbi:MAG: hypothetical protein HeimC3_48500 [Candidatus Heimdallarchaeota archaeon LC_3]|nr:MAG: hypothetical protein HeimC3_48500 [Candidatus Heimdallarchaeota archaeon LC_3]